MKIPKSITILGRKFAVRNNLTEKQMIAFMGDGTCPLGAFNYSKRVIAVRHHQNKEEQHITFYHECLHAMQYVVGLNQVTNLDIAEIWCESGANAIYDMFKACR